MKNWAKSLGGISFNINTDAIFNVDWRDQGKSRDVGDDRWRQPNRSWEI